MIFENPAMLIGLILWFVGFIFVLNGLNMAGRMEPRECGIWNLSISIFMFFCVVLAMVFQLFGPATWITVGGILLFAFTYFMIGMNSLMGTDSRGLGWYCLLVAGMTPFIAHGAYAAGDLRFAIIWLIWGVAWFVFYLIMALGWTFLAGRFLGLIMVLLGLGTGTVPGYMMLRGWW